MWEYVCTSRKNWVPGAPGIRIKCLFCQSLFAPERPSVFCAILLFNSTNANINWTYTRWRLDSQQGGGGGRKIKQGKHKIAFQCVKNKQTGNRGMLSLPYNLLLSSSRCLSLAVSDSVSVSEGFARRTIVKTEQTCLTFLKPVRDSFTGT